MATRLVACEMLLSDLNAANKSKSVCVCVRGSDRGEQEFFPCICVGLDVCVS